jgi:hypothetical protein
MPPTANHRAFSKRADTLSRRRYSSTMRTLRKSKRFDVKIAALFKTFRSSPCSELKDNENYGAYGGSIIISNFQKTCNLVVDK